VKISKMVPVVAVLIAVAGCSAPSPADRAKELDRMYAEGQAARGRMDKTGKRSARRPARPCSWPRG
jgi:hypothetical protein